MASADARKVRRAIQALSEVTAKVNDESMFQAAEDFIDNVRHELYLSQPEDQVGFDAEQFVSNLSRTMTRDPDGAWVVDAVAAGGDEGDFEAIAGSYNRAEHLWHGGTGNTAAFYRRIRFDPIRSNRLAGARQSLWGDMTPQWFLLNYGSPEAGQAATFFLENAVDATTLNGVAARVREDLEEAWHVF